MVGPFVIFSNGTNLGNCFCHMPHKFARSYVTLHLCIIQCFLCPLFQAQNQIGEAGYVKSIWNCNGVLSAIIIFNVKAECRDALGKETEKVNTGNEDEKWLKHSELCLE